MVWSESKHLYRLLSTALFSICLSVLKSIFRELGRAERKSSHKQTLMLYGELFVRQYDFIDYYFPEILLIFPLSSLFSFISERIVTKTIKTTSSRRDGKYLQLLFSRMHQKKIDVGGYGARGLSVYQNSQTPKSQCPREEIHMFICCSDLQYSEGRRRLFLHSQIVTQGPPYWARLPKLTTKALLSNFIQFLFLKYEIFLESDTVVTS